LADGVERGRLNMVGQAVPPGVKVVALAITGVVYVLPSLIGYFRGVRNLGSVVLINLVLGWSFIGWLVALGMAVRSAPRERRYS
jgi:Superinfection immunity protein